MVRVVRLERTVSWSQTRRDTNFAIPGYSIAAIISRREGKSKIFLSVVIHVVKSTFAPLSATGESPANAGVARLCGALPCPVPDTATALPKQARYQLRYTRLLSYFVRLGVFSQIKRDTSFATPGYSISVIIPRRRGKSKIFLSVVIHVVKAVFPPDLTGGESPAIARVAMLSVLLLKRLMDRVYAHPNHAFYQLNYRRMCYTSCEKYRQVRCRERQRTYLIRFPACLQE